MATTTLTEPTVETVETRSIKLRVKYVRLDAVNEHLIIDNSGTGVTFIVHNGDATVKPLAVTLPPETVKRMVAQLRKMI